MQNQNRCLSTPPFKNLENESKVTIFNSGYPMKILENESKFTIFPRGYPMKILENESNFTFFQKRKRGGQDGGQMFAGFNCRRLLIVCDTGSESLDVEFFKTEVY